MRNVCESWNGICKELCRANAPLSVKMAPKLLDFGAKIEPLAGYYDQNKARACIQFSATLFQSLNKLISKVYRTWEANSTCLCYPMAPVSVPPMPKFGRK